MQSRGEQRRVAAIASRTLTGTLTDTLTDTFTDTLTDTLTGILTDTLTETLTDTLNIKVSKCIEFFCLGLSMRISLQMTTIIQSEQMY